MEPDFELLMNLIFDKSVQDEFIRECRENNIVVEKQCHKPSSLYYRCYCEEKKEEPYCEECEFWYV
jgi:hypothetical protein